MEEGITVVALVVIGVMFGSFVNAFVWRWRQTHDDEGNRKKLSKKKAAELSIMTGRSMCPHCKEQLKSYDLIPIGSWLSVGGKCRYCHTKIGLQYPLVELLTGLLFVGSYIWWPYGFSTLGWAQFTVWQIVVVGLVILSVYDLRWLLLPFKLIYPLLGLALSIAVLRSVDTGDVAILFNASVAALVLTVLFYGLHTFSGGKWMGGGDVVAAPVLGLLAGGLGEVFLLLFSASVLGLLVGLPMIIHTKDRKLQIPFGPMLFTATYFVFLLGSQIVDWYLDSLLV